MLRFEDSLTYGHRVIDFYVSKDTSSISLKGTTLKKGLIYGYLYDPDAKFRASILLQNRGANVAFSAVNATQGGLSGQIIAGLWTLHLYNIDSEKRQEKVMPYEIEVLFNLPVATSELNTTPVLTEDNRITFDYDAVTKPEHRWYRGDFHSHTTLSDGNCSLEMAVEIVGQQALDFMFLTEHNICHTALPDKQDCLLLPSLEVTVGKGHMNVHGIRRSLDMFNTDFSSEALIKQGLQLSDGFPVNIGINHPKLKPWSWTFDEMLLSEVGTVEICCDPTWPTSPLANAEALELLTTIWNCGHRITAIGGSDAHLLPHERYGKAAVASIYGDPATFVFCQGLSGTNIIEALSKGHTYIERQCGLNLLINNGDILPGQDVGQMIITSRLSVQDDSIPYYVECVTNKGVVSHHPVSLQEIEIVVDMSNYAWARFDIRRGVKGQEGAGEFEGTVNPIYNGTHSSFHQPLVETWGEMMQLHNAHG